MTTTNRLKVHAIGGGVSSAFTLQSPVTSFQAFPSGSVRYCALASTGEWQIGTGVVSGSSMTRGDIEENYLGTLNQIDFTGLTVQIAQVLSAEDVSLMLGRLTTNEAGILNNSTQIALKVEDKGEWAEGHYDYNDQVSLDGFLSRCVNPDGCDTHPIPQASGSSNLYFDTINDSGGSPVSAPVFVKSNGGASVTRTGQYYKFIADVKILGIYVRVPKVTPDTTYALVFIEDPYSSTPIKQIFPLANLVKDTWFELNRFDLNWPANKIGLVYLESFTTPRTTEYNGAYNYVTPGGAIPVSGQIVRSASGDITRIAVTDADGDIDISSAFFGNSETKTIKVTQEDDSTKWEEIELIGSGTLLGTGPNDYYEFTSILLSSGVEPDNGSKCNAVVTLFHDGSNTEYYKDEDYWIGTDVEGIMQGFEQIGNNASVSNNSAYGVDILVQNVTDSSDWQIRASGANNNSTSSIGRKILVYDLGSFGSGEVNPDYDTQSNIFKLTLTAAGVTINPPSATLTGQEGIEGGIRVINGDVNAPIWPATWDWGAVGEPVLTANTLIGYYKEAGMSTTMAWYESF